jgi:hypothetical protein
VNIPLDAPVYSAERDCSRNRCIVAQIARERVVLADRSLLPAIRAEALKFLIHFVGDLHQPLHASDNGDRGGNDVRVVLARKRTNLHALWDTALVAALGRDPVSLGTSLEAKISLAQKQQWQGGSSAEWANESLALARTEIYAALGGTGDTNAPLILPNDYAAAKAPIVKTQLQKAGVRLAWVLNEAFK